MISNTKEIQEQINSIKNKFRLLDEWKISFLPATDLDQAIVIFDKENPRLATIYGFCNREEVKVPEDYYMHEVLHCAVRELTRIDRRKNHLLREAEEALVQDLCKVIYESNK